MEFSDLKCKTLATIEQEIEGYKTEVFLSTWEIGRRLLHVQTHQLLEVPFKEWLRTLGISYQRAFRMIYIAKHLPDIRKYQHLGATALYLIASIPSQWRSVKIHLPDGQAKYLQQMTNQELQWVKRHLQRLRVVTEGQRQHTVPLTPFSQGQVQSNQETCDHMPLPPHLEAQLIQAQETILRLRQEMQAERSQHVADLKQAQYQTSHLEDFRRGLSHVAARSNRFGTDLEATQRLIDFSHEIDHLLLTLAPMRFFEELESLTNPAVRARYRDQIDRVQYWVDEMRQALQLPTRRREVSSVADEPETATVTVA